MPDLNLDPSRDETAWDLATILIDNISSEYPKHRPPKTASKAKKPIKRAGRACCRCRARKVRCDVSIQGHPCTNCSWEEVDCMEAGPRRCNKKSKNHASGTRGEERGYDSTAHDSESSPCSISLLRSYQEPSPSASTENRTRDFLSDYSNTLPQIFSPLPPTLSPEDINYLRKKGALSIPECGLQGKLFRSYVSSVHSHMPFLDLRHFANVVGQQEIETKVSLLLFQAVMLAGCASVSMQHLIAAGFQTRAEAQKILINRVKLLYDFDIETNTLDTIQALLLMAQCRASRTVSGTKDRWHWLGVAISMAYRIDLHCCASHPNSPSEIAYEDEPLRRRVWWTCFMLDRLVSVMEGKPARISKESCSTKMLRMEDFDVEETIDSIDGTRNEFCAEDLSEMAEVHMAKLLMCWSFDDITSHQTTIGQQQASRIITTADTILSNSDASPIGSDYWVDELRGCSSLYTDSTRTESIATCSADNCLTNIWVSEFCLGDYSELEGF